MKKLAFAAMTILTLLCIPFVVHAQASTDVGNQIGTAVDAAGARDWQLSLAAVLGLVAWALRRFAAPSNFFQTRNGGLIITGLSAAIGALVPVLYAHAFTINALISAMTSGVTAALAISTPQGTAARAVPPPSSAPQQPPPALMLLIGFGLALGSTEAIGDKACASELPQYGAAHGVIACTKTAGSSLVPVVGSIQSDLLDTAVDEREVLL